MPKTVEVVDVDCDEEDPVPAKRLRGGQPPTGTGTGPFGERRTKMLDGLPPIGQKWKGTPPKTQRQRLKEAAGRENLSPRQLAANKFKAQSWVDRNFPSSLEDLFVHKKKVEEVHDWLKSSIEAVERNDPKVKNAVAVKKKVLVITGPSGAGKTATVFLAAKQLGVQVKEWINPMSLTDFNENRLVAPDPDEIHGSSQFDLFSEFLFRASQYRTIPMKGKPRSESKVIVVEDFPNIFYRNSNMFHNNILRNYASMGKFPVIFIVSDSSSRESNATTLFPKPILAELNIGCITFNAVAPTYITKFLTTVCSKEGVLTTKSMIDAIAATSGGDVRCAINTLQFKLSAGSSRTSFKAPPPAKKKGNEKSVATLTDVQKDDTLFLFRALGKILYAKRNVLESVDPCYNVPKNSMKYLRHNPLESDPEDLVEKIEAQTDVFLNLLQQNYITFFGKLDDIVLASEFLSDSDYLISRWPFTDGGTISRSYKEREAREEIALLMSARGLMFANMNQAKHQFRPLRKSMMGDVRSKVQTCIENTREAFPLDGPICSNFFFEQLSFYSKFVGKSKYCHHFNSGQKTLISQVGVLVKNMRHYRQGPQDMLSEKDAVEDSEDEEDPKDSDNSNSVEVKVMPGASHLVPVIEESGDDEDYKIEDFSDED